MLAMPYLTGSHYCFHEPHCKSSYLHETGCFFGKCYAGKVLPMMSSGVHAGMCIWIFTRKLDTSFVLEC